MWWTPFFISEKAGSWCDAATWTVWLQRDVPTVDAAKFQNSISLITHRFSIDAEVSNCTDEGMASTEGRAATKNLTRPAGRLMPGATSLPGCQK